MRLSTRLLHFIEDAFTLGVTLASDAIDSWSTQETRGHLLERLRDSAQRGAELAMENAKLKDEIDGLRFNGPSLYRDEVMALRDAIGHLENFGSEADAKPIYSLIDRCDHLPMTAKELADQIDDVTSGRVKLLNWEDVFRSDDLGKDVDDCDHRDAYGNLADDSGLCMLCRKVTCV